MDFAYGFGVLVDKVARSNDCFGFRTFQMGTPVGYHPVRAQAEVADDAVVGNGRIMRDPIDLTEKEAFVPSVSMLLGARSRKMPA